MMRTTNEPVSVEARFDEEGTVTPTAFTWRDRTYHISDVGRRWMETNGPYHLYHCLVMTPTGETFELCLNTSTLQWQLVRTWERPKAV
jgi:hypothetical protein